MKKNHQENGLLQFYAFKIGRKAERTRSYKMHNIPPVFGAYKLQTENVIHVVVVVLMHICDSL